MRDTHAGLTFTRAFFKDFVLCKLNQLRSGQTDFRGVKYGCGGVTLRVLTRTHTRSD